MGNSSAKNEGNRVFFSDGLRGMKWKFVSPTKGSSWIVTCGFAYSER